MKKLVFCTSLAVLTFFACNKPAGTNTARLNGKWRMVEVKENATGIVTTRPAGMTRHVDILFTSTSDAGGIFTGNTPTNDIWEGAFSIGTNNSLAIPWLSMTKVMETPWGNEFVANIRNAQKYSFGDYRKLAIKTPVKTLVFQKIQ